MSVLDFSYIVTSFSCKSGVNVITIYMTLLLLSVALVINRTSSTF